MARREYANIDEFRELAWRRLPRPIFDYIDGGAGSEISVRNNRAQFDAYSFCHRVGVDVAQRHQSVTLFGQRYDSPFVIGPTGLPALAWPKADIALAQAAEAAGIPITCSMVGSVPLEELMASTSNSKWFQFYMFQRRDLSYQVLKRAELAGFEVLVVTLDCQVGGRRERDIRNQFSIPLRPNLKGIWEIVSHPSWCLQMLSHRRPRPENLVDESTKSFSAESLVAYIGSQLDPSVTWEDVREARKRWAGPLVIKGILHPDDALMAADIGADGIVISNHGGRQLDGAISPMVQLPEIADRLNHRLTIFIDSGFRRGTDILKAMCLGADAVFLGRALLYATAAAGADGAIAGAKLLRDEIDTTLALLGCPNVNDLDDSFLVNLRDKSGVTDQAEGDAYGLSRSHG